MTSTRPPYREGITDHQQARVLMCDGPLLLSYVSVCQLHAFTAAQRRAFRAVLPRLRKRVLLDHHAATSAIMRDVLDVALDVVDRAAFVVDARGRVVNANTLGRAALDATPEVRVEISTALAGATTELESHRVVRDGRTAYLVLGRKTSLAQVSRALADELGLHGTHRRVLIAAASSESTKQLSARLGIATSTVEYHLTRLFRRLGVATRAELHQLFAERRAFLRQRAA